MYRRGTRARERPDLFIGQKADPEVDEITVDGRPLTQEGQKRYLMLNKPRGYVCTLSDEKGRKTVAELVRDCGARAIPSGGSTSTPRDCCF